MPGLVIAGPNGSGKTTLGRCLAQRLACAHLDAEDFAFLPSDAPYSRPRPREETQALLLEAMRQHPRFILTAVSGDFGPEADGLYAGALWLDAPLALRLSRVRQRSLQQLGQRAMPGGICAGMRKRSCVMSQAAAWTLPKPGCADCAARCCAWTEPCP